MIFDKLERAEKYYSLNQNFQKGFEYVKSHNLKTLKPGKYNIDGENMFLIISHDSPEAEFINKMESHRRYIDVQIPLEGTFNLGWKAWEDCTNVISYYNQDKDVTLFADNPDFELKMSPDTFAIMMPVDAHHHQQPKMHVKKATVKIKI